jgi:erythromycin esterase
MGTGSNAPTRSRCALVLALGLTLVSCAASPDKTATPLATPDPIVSWIQQHALRLRTTNPGGSDTDLAPLAQIVSSASLVGLGEETHGTHEVIDVKARLTEYLISHLGFTTFVMENNWGSSQLLDAYINGGTGDLPGLMARSLFGSWQTHEYEALFAWLRAWNTDPSHTAKVRFLGMDIQAVSQSDFDDVTQYLQQVDPQQVSSAQALYAPIMTASLPNPYPSYYALSASEQQQYEAQAQQVYALLQAHQQTYTVRSSAERFAFALQNARIIVQCTTYLNGANREGVPLSGYYQRDNFMAENVEWLHDHLAGPTPKMIVWAHDAHIANVTDYGSPDGKNLGGDLRATYGSSYLAIGTTLYQGSFRAYHYPTGIVEALPPATSDTYNYELGRAGLRYYMLDLRTIPAGAVKIWASGDGSAANLITVGLGGEHLTASATLSGVFDVVVHIQQSSPAQHL